MATAFTKGRISVLSNMQKAAQEIAKPTGNVSALPVAVQDIVIKAQANPAAQAQAQAALPSINAAVEKARKAEPELVDWVEGEAPYNPDGKPRKATSNALWLAIIIGSSLAYRAMQPKNKKRK